MEYCLDALHQCHLRHGGSDAENVGQAPSAVSALQIARKFAAKASNRLSQQQIHQLIQFLRGPARDKAQNMESLEQSLARKVEEFHSTEVESSGEGRDKLAHPGGPADANLGLILHVQCEDDVRGGFWDSRSATISLLNEKGIHETFAFGYDWHWRAQGRFHRNARCPALAWSPQLREFHNQFSSDLLEMLPLPFVITASSCARDNLREYLPKTAVSLEIELAASAIVLRFDLDIKTDGTLRRIILHLPHPTAGFFTSRKNRESMAIQIDAGMNFMLWLMGKDYNPTSFTNRYSGSRPRFVHTAPLSEMWGYVRKEAVEGKPLRLEDYSPSFLSWVYRYIGHDPALVIATGASLAGTAAKKAVQRIHKRSTPNSSPIPFQVAEPNDSDNQESTGNTTNTSVARSQNRSPFTLHRPRVDDLDIPIPLDDSYGENEEEEFLTTEVEADSEKAGEPATCNGTIVNKAQAQKILSFGSTPRIYFSPTDIEIRLNEKVVYTKPIERLLGSLQGAEWLSQLILEREALQATLYKDEHTEAEPHGDLGLVSHAHRGATWKNGELKRRLLQGANFHCCQLKSHGAHIENRVVVRGAQLTIPLKANTQTVCVRVDLVPEGTYHPYKCINGGEADDPAHRLSIQIRYRTIHENTPEESWFRTSGQGNIKKFNSLVDFLEDKDEDWIAKQPRRFLDRDHSRKRFKTSYTS
ncbi:hypothetical protein ACLMJK_004191 [Lecanora helva]